MQARWEDPNPPSGGMQASMPGLTPVVRALILINAAVFLLSFLLDLSGTAAWPAIRDTFGLKPDLWREWFPFLPVWQLVSYGFLHDTEALLHVVMNMLFLYFLGTMLEGIVGGRRFLVLYLTALVVAGAATVLVGLLAGETRPTIGASGGVLAVVVAMAVLRPHLRVIFIIFPITLKVLALIYVGVDLFGALNSLRGFDSGVAHLAHLSGAAYGFLAVRRGWVWRDPLMELGAWRRRREREQLIADEARLDQLLAKINRDGIHSLSTREKAFLKRASKRRS